jgi:hypothetical protein
MARDFDVDGKWLGDHVKSCQRETCKNPTGSLINCFSCQRAFCKNCWKIVSKMPQNVKAAKEFTSCSINPPEQNPSPLLPGRAGLPRGRPRNSSNQPSKLTNGLQHIPNAHSKHVASSDSDDSENETEKMHNVSPTSTSNSSALEILTARNAQQNGHHLQSSKRLFEEIFEDSTEDVEEQAAKRSRASPSASLVPVSSDKSPSSPSSSRSQTSPSCHSDDGQNNEDKGTQYISEGSYHTLQEWAMEHASFESHNKEKSRESHPTEAREGDERGDAVQTSDTGNDVDSIEDTGVSSTFGKGDGQRTEHDSNILPENHNVAIGIQCQSSSREQPDGPSPVNSHAGMDIPCSETEHIVPRDDKLTLEGKVSVVESMAAQCSRTAPGFSRPQYQSPYDPSMSSPSITAAETCANPNLARQTQQLQPQIYHRHHIPQTQSLVLQEQDTSTSGQQTLFQVNSPLACSTPSGYGSQPAQSLESHGIVGLSSPPTIPFPTQLAAQQVSAQTGCLNSRPSLFRYAFTEQDIESLPADQTKAGDGWFVHYNPQLPRLIDVSLLHTFRHESAVVCVRFSPDGKCIATGSNGTVQMFDTLSGHFLGVLRIEPTSNPPRDMYIRCLCFSPDGKYLAMGSDDALVRVRWFESRRFWRENAKGNRRSWMYTRKSFAMFLVVMKTIFIHLTLPAIVVL